MKYCNSCIKLVKDRLTDNAFRVLVGLYRKGALNRDGLVIQTKLSTSLVRDGINHLYGAGLIDIEKMGTSTILSLSEAGQELMKQIEREIK